MNSKFRYDKKQLPQVIVMGILSIGLFGYFGWRMVAPPPTQAAAVTTTKPAVQPAPAQTSAVNPVSATAAVAAMPAAADTPTDASTAAPQMDALAPGPDMRDPFVAPRPEAPKTVTVSAPPLPPAVKMAGNPGMPALPFIQPLQIAGLPQAPRPAGPVVPAAPAGPAWQVTGVIVGDAVSANHVAILRDGDQRRYVRPGQMVDGEFRVETVDQDGVTLSRGSEKFRLTLGGDPAPTKHVPVPNGASTTGISSNQDNQKPESIGRRRTLNAGLFSSTE